MTKTLHHRACHLCEAICGLTIETEDRDDGRHILSIKGDAQDSFSRGHICPKAVALQDIQNDPDRVRQPLRKVDGHWQPIAWTRPSRWSPSVCRRSRPSTAGTPWPCTRATPACTTTG